MTNWAINLNNVGRENALVANDQLKLPRTIEEGERVLLFQTSGEDIVFQQSTAVEFIKTESNSEGAELVSAIQLSAPTDLQAPSYLSALTFSLELISRFDSPSRHFRRPIRKISNNDFATIESQTIFWARSAFGFHVNALPADRFIAFVQLVALNAPSLLIDSPNFLRLWPLLRDWIQEEYVDAASYALAVRETVERISEGGTPVPFDQIRVSTSDVEGAMSGSLSRLVSNLDSFYLSTEIVASNLRPIADARIAESVYDEIDNMIAENRSSEDQFEKAFTGKKWPITRPIKI